MRSSGVLIFVLLALAIVVLSSMVIQPNSGSDFSHSAQTSQCYSPSASTNSLQITFSETGLTGKNWSVTLNDVSVNSTKDTISFYVPPGNYTYTIGAPPGYAPSIKSGFVDVTNQSVFISINFMKMVVFTFYQAGLPNGDRWSVTINGTHYYSTNSTVVIHLPTGNYSYTIQLPEFYSTTNPSGSIGPGNSTVGLNVTHLPTEYIIIIVVLVLVDAGIIAAVMRMRRKRKR